eukprot:15434891-Alexandrium_andersonii.AAC.1
MRARGLLHASGLPANDPPALFRTINLAPLPEPSPSTHSSKRVQALPRYHHSESFTFRSRVRHQAFALASFKRPKCRTPSRSSSSSGGGAFAGHVQHKRFRALVQAWNASHKHMLHTRTLNAHKHKQRHARADAPRLQHARTRAHTPSDACAQAC